MKIFNSIFIIAVLLFFNSCVPAQSKSDYKLPWTTESNSVKYYVFFQEGTSSMSSSYTLQDGMDYKLGATSLRIDSVNSPTTEYIKTQIQNDGKYIVFGIVGVGSDGLYGPMGVSAPFKKPVAPAKVTVLPVLRLP